MSASSSSTPPSRSRRTAPRPADPYHHGALREALLAAAEGILAEQGVEGFTLRECARRAGVSHAAPAHHFKDAQGLLTELAARGFERMLALMQAGPAAGAGADPTARLGAAGRAYVRFALENRALFQLMFRQDRLDRGSERLRDAGTAAFDQLQSALAAALAAHGVVPADFPARLLLAWSTVHGFATLLLEQRLDAFRGGQTAAAFARSMGDELLRLLTASLIGTPAR
jgi:AcrR family transcriptional regulator